MLRRLPILAPLFRLAVCLVAGIVAGDLLQLPLAWLLAAFVLSVTVTAWWRGRVGQSVWLCLCFVLLGTVLVTREAQRLAVEWPESELTLEAVVVSEPQEKPKTVGVDVLTAKGGQRLKCYVAKDARSQSIHVGDGLLLRARVRENSDYRIGTFNYKRYLEVHGFTGSMYVPARGWHKQEVSLKDVPRAERVRLAFLKYRHRLLQQFREQGVADEAYAVVAAMTLGDKSALKKELKEVYSVSGASHVLALSGLHLGIIYALLSLLVVGRLRVVMQVLLVVSMWAFALLVGLSPSVVRSAFMLSVYALLSQGGRKQMSLNVLCFTVICMLTVSPLAVFDVGFQMSVLAMLAILVLYPWFYGLLPMEFLQSHWLCRWVWGMLCVSLSAQLGVAPLIAYYFGRFSTLFLLTNFLVVPFATLILYLSLALLLCLLFPWLLLASWLSWLLVSVVNLLNRALTAIASCPLASVDDLHPSLLQVVLLYVVLVACYFLLVRLNKSIHNI